MLESKKKIFKVRIEEDRKPDRITTETDKYQSRMQKRLQKDPITKKNNKSVRNQEKVNKKSKTSLWTIFVAKWLPERC